MLTLFNLTLGYALYLIAGYNIIRQTVWYVNMGTHNEPEETEEES